ncbi:MAG: hypothetical protein SFV54_29210 [Bryobacteraceae bacterium]|nr:hypothetical protein [Bryobacteraceae bacterium]
MAAELRLARGIAEIVGDTPVLGASGGILGQDRHTTNGIDDFSGSVVMVVHFSLSGRSRVRVSTPEEPISLRLGVLLGVLIELTLATSTAEVIGFALILAATGRFFRIDLHAANQVFFHWFHLFLF